MNLRIILRISQIKKHKKVFTRKNVYNINQDLKVVLKDGVVYTQLLHIEILDGITRNSISTSEVITAINIYERIICKEKEE